MARPFLQFHNLNSNPIGFFIIDSEEQRHLISVSWTIETVRLMVEPSLYRLDANRCTHAIQMAEAPANTATPRAVRIRRILGWNRNRRIPYNLQYFAMKIIIWNCRGAGNEDFRRAMADLCRDHSPEIFVLLETRIPFSNMGNFFHQFNLTNSRYVDPVGRSGGIWLLWNPQLVTVRVFEVTAQAIHATISKNNFVDWVISSVYASPDSRRRDLLWDNMSSTANDLGNTPWLAAGDFNDYADTTERRGSNSPPIQRRCMKFRDRVNSCNLMDLGSSGPRLTWTNGRGGLANTMLRLDRAMANVEWRIAFPSAAVRNLPRISSDHCPLLIAMTGHYKLNTDASVSLNQGLASVGGLIRDDAGNWIVGFMGRVGNCPSLLAELWAIFYGLCIVSSRQLSGTEVESDCQVAVHLINDKAYDHPYVTIIRDCVLIMERYNCKLNHVMREANFSADHLAKLGNQQPEELVIMERPPRSLAIWLKADICGTCFPRGS